VVAPEVENGPGLATQELGAGGGGKTNTDLDFKRLENLGRKVWSVANEVLQRLLTVDDHDKKGKWCTLKERVKL